ncbi:ROK family protein [Flavobacterium plurextorum]|uniref:ROK family transcriptional regulator n=1 Tax=Flavobacterium plurextorum TaxID=1114867 RepID=A0ABX4D0N3_9FLAO|nr:MULTISPECIES: ROK family transcriptional regulator [Flavobacterium]OXB11257.1 ROK family transcriptional regulator [Flavobacterium plurextorum]PIF70792.1 putative NBD/HSP70 family sugar kinase [Flavobacterium sp. 2]UUW07994.1 ROK family transcriptional regulator [Flavobacterium plurextorum]
MSLKDLLDNSKDKSLSEQKWHMLRQFITKRLLTGGNATIAELSAEIQSSVPTVTKAVNELLAEGYVVDMGKITNSGGRRPSLFSINPTCAYFLGVEVGLTSMSIGLQNIKNELVSIELGTSFTLENTQESLLQFCNLINSFIEDSSVEKKLIVGVCINFSGRINSMEGFSYNYFFSENRPLTEIISEQLDLPVHLENDTRAMAFGEYCEGVVDDEQNIIFVNYSWGVAIGMITDGKLYYGKSGYSGEFGHSTIFNNEIMCKCGKLGCLETEISGWSLVNQFKEAVKEGKQSKVVLDDSSSELQHHTIIKGAINLEDTLCVDLVTQQSEKMGRYLSILLNIFNPDLLVIGGDFAQLGDYSLLPIQSALKKYSLGLVNRDMKLKKSTLGRRAGVIGACCVIKEKMLFPLINN